MPESPLDPFDHDPAPLQFPGAIAEHDNAGGVVTELVTQATAALTQYQEYTDGVQGLHLSTFDGDTALVSRVELVDQKVQPFVPSAVPDKTVASSGLAAWFRRRFSRNPQAPATGSSHYEIRLGHDDDQVTVKAVTLHREENYSSANAERTVQTAEGPVGQPLEGEELAAAVVRATTILKEGLPLPADQAIIERQKKPCHSILGPEAAGVAKAIESVSVQDNPNIGDQAAPQIQRTLDVILPRHDGQWSVAQVGVAQRKGTVVPNIAGPKGRSVLTFIHFVGGGQIIEGQWISGAVTVGVESVFSHETNRLINAKVAYFVTQDGHREPIQIGSAGRAEIHQAIASQVDPGNLVAS